MTDKAQGRVNMDRRIGETKFPAPPPDKIAVHFEYFVVYSFLNFSEPISCVFPRFPLIF